MRYRWPAPKGFRTGVNATSPAPKFELPPVTMNELSGRGTAGSVMSMN